MTLWYPKRDDDNTPQGKLAHGCMVMVWWGFVLLILFGLTDFLPKDCSGFSGVKSPFANQGAV